MKDIREFDLPFFFGVQDQPGNGGLPPMMPFKYYFDYELKMYRQVVDDGLRRTLNQVYLSGSMLNGEMNANDGGHQGKAALEFIHQNFSIYKNSRILEIGCGNGFILKELAKKGAECIGLEPGPQISAIQHVEGISIINDFFPSKLIKGNFDLILHFNVIEHLENPLEMLLEQGNLLTSGGKIIFGMPNCEPNLESGDISIFAHEHFNYFTRDSFIAIAEKAGFIITELTTGASEGMIFCAFMKKGEAVESSFAESKNNWTIFEEKIQRCLFNLKTVINQVNPADIVIYCPKRALNALSLLGLNECRLVDDTPTMNEKFLPFFLKPVENFESLASNPPGLIIIFSRTFGETIRRKCKSSPKLKDVQVSLLAEFD